MMDYIHPLTPAAFPRVIKKCRLIQQSEPEDLIRDLNLSKQQAEFPRLRLLQWNLLAKEPRMSLLRKRPHVCSRYCRMQGLKWPDGRAGLGFAHDLEERRLHWCFENKLESELLHIGNVKPSTPE